MTHLPCTIQLVISDEIGMIAVEGVKNKRLICLWDLGVGKSPLVRQIHLGWNRARHEARSLGIELDVDCFARLDAHYELVAGNVFEDTLCDVMVLNSNLHFGFVESWERLWSGVRL